MVSPDAPLAFNGRFSGTPQPTGTQTATFHLYDAILRTERRRPVVVFADPRFPGVAAWADLPRTTLVPVPFQDWPRSRSQLWEQAVFNRRARRFGCALAHHPITTCPVWQGGMATVVTVQDINFYRYPEWYSFLFRQVLLWFAIPGIRRADGVVVISDYVGETVIKHLHLAREKVRRIYYGIKFSRPIETAVATPAVPYVLCVGSLQPHKNLARLIEAWRLVRRDQPDLELWVAGRAQPRFADQPELAALLQTPGLRQLGYLDDTALLAAYRGARAFCFPSLEEGFGLPILEAMIAGVPVVTSQASCLPETGGPACEYADPHNIESLAAALRHVLTLSDDLRRRRIDEGYAWVERFRWDDSARAYLDYFEEVLAAKDSPSQRRRATSGPS